MRSRRLFLVLVTLVAVAWILPARAQVAQGTALMRFMLGTSKYGVMRLELDGQVVLEQPSNTISDPVAVDAARSHTLALYGQASQIDEGGPQLIRRITNYRLAAGSFAITAFADDGTEHRIAQTSGVLADRSLLVPTLAGRASTSSGPVLRFGDLNLGFVSGLNGGSVEKLATPQTARLELRLPDSNASVRAEILRARPGYRYDIIVIPLPEVGAEAYQWVIVPTSLQYAVYPTLTQRFSETGHLLEGRFRQYWQGTGGLPVFGYPLNDDHFEGTTEGGFVTQVFERNRFEHHPANKAPYDVLLGRLGDERLRQLGRDWRKEYEPRPVAAGCAATAVDGRQIVVCEPFLTYYRTHGLQLDTAVAVSSAESLALLGLPLTQASTETNSSGDRVLTQWFERARLEYHPGNPPGQQILLGRLGAEVYNLQPLTFDDEDRDFKRGFSAPDAVWQEATGGFAGHFWYACVPASRGTSSSALWHVNVPQGTYELQVFVPGTHANVRLGGVSVYGVGADYGLGGSLNQKPYSDAWVPVFFGQLQHSIIELSTGEAQAGNCTYQLAADAIRLVPRPERWPTHTDAQKRFRIDYPFDWTVRAPVEPEGVTFEAPGKTSLLSVKVLPTEAAPPDLRAVDVGVLFSGLVRSGATSDEVFGTGEKVFIQRYTGVAPDGTPVAGAVSLLRQGGRLYAALYRTDPDRWVTERAIWGVLTDSLRPTP